MQADAINRPMQSWLNVEIVSSYLTLGTQSTQVSFLDNAASIKLLLPTSVKLEYSLNCYSLIDTFLL